MKKTILMLLVLVLTLALTGCAGQSETASEPAASAEPAAAEAAPEAAPADAVSPEETLAQADQECAAAGEAMTARQAESSLYDRVGGRDGLNAVVTDTIAFHLENDAVKHLFEPINQEHLISQVTDFLVVATGGEGEYNGRDMTEAHAHLNLTNLEFLEAGNDLRMAMEKNGWGEDEIQELHCAFLSLRSQVIPAAEGAGEAGSDDPAEAPADADASK